MRQQLDDAARKIAESIEATADRWLGDRCLQLCESLKVLESLAGYRLPLKSTETQSETQPGSDPVVLQTTSATSLGQCDKSQQVLEQSLCQSPTQSTLPVSDEKVSSAPQAAPVDKNSSPEHFGYLNGALNRLGSGNKRSFREKLTFLAAEAACKVEYYTPGTLLHSLQSGRAEAFDEAAKLLADGSAE